MNIINSMLNSQKLYEVTNIEYDKQQRITQLELDLDHNPGTPGVPVKDVDSNGLITAKDILPVIVNKVESMPQIEYVINVLEEANDFFYQELKQLYIPQLIEKKDKIELDIENKIRLEKMNQYQEKVQMIKEAITEVQDAYQALDEIGFDSAVDKLIKLIGLDRSMPDLILDRKTIFEPGYFAIPAYSAETVNMRMELIFKGVLPKIEIQGEQIEVSSIKGYGEKIYYTLNKEVFLVTENGQNLPFCELNKLNENNEVLDGRIKMVLYRDQNGDLLQVKDAFLDFSTDQKLLAATGNGYILFTEK